MKTCYKPGRKTFVHANMPKFRKNLKDGTNEPAITVKNGADNHYGYAAMIKGPAYIQYSGNHKTLLSCGARVAVTSRYPVEIDETFQDHPLECRNQIIISRSSIRSNKVNDALDPVILMQSGDEMLAGFGAMIEGDVIVRQCYVDGVLSMVIETDADVVIDTTPPEEEAATMASVA